MEDLDKKWIWNEGDSCSGEDQVFSKRLGLKNLEGIFILVAGGIFSGIPLIVIELAYDRCKRRFGWGKSSHSTQQSGSDRPPSFGEAVEGSDRPPSFGEAVEGNEHSYQEVLYCHRKLHG